VKVYVDKVLDTPVSVRIVEDKQDRLAFAAWVDERRDSWVAVDTEASGLDMYSEGWSLRMVQFGDLTEAWVLPIEGEEYEANVGAVSWALKALSRQVAHNRPFDAEALKAAGLDHRLWEGSDTMIMAHIIDSRGREDGGIGHGLKALASHYLDPTLTDSDEALKAWAKGNGVKLADRFSAAPLRLPELEHYAGMDCILTAGLFRLFMEMIEEKDQTNLLDFEHAVQAACSDMSSRGIRLDTAYAQALTEYFLDEEDVARQELDALGIENPNSVDQVRKALSDAGVTLHNRTANGKFSVSKEALEGVDHPAVKLVQTFRHATKFRVSYVESSLAVRDANDRVHPNIRSLVARTARMSVSNPPLQQLPASDALIRRMFVADPGMVICSADYSQVELRVLAELAGEEKMLEAIANGVDLHTNTAELVGISRKVAKMTNFLIVYGGGAGKLSTSAGIPLSEAKEAIDGFHRAFPSVRRYGNRLQDRSGYGARPIVTPSGRRLNLDRDRTYAAINYMVQSTARDVLAEAILEIGDHEDLRELMLMPVHDELVFQAPREEANEVADKVAAIMTRKFGSVLLEAEGDVYGPSWGHGYMDTAIPYALKEFF